MSNQTETFECTKCNKSFLITDKDSHDLRCLYSLEIKDSEITDIPCDTCGKMIPFDNYVIHQNTCGIDKGLLNDIYSNMRMKPDLQDYCPSNEESNSENQQLDTDSDDDMPGLEEVNNGEGYIQKNMFKIFENVLPSFMTSSEDPSPQPVIEEVQIEDELEGNTNQNVTTGSESSLTQRIETLKKKIKDVDENIKNLHEMVDVASDISNPENNIDSKPTVRPSQRHNSVQTTSSSSYTQFSAQMSIISNGYDFRTPSENITETSGTVPITSNEDVPPLLIEDTITQPNTSTDSIDPEENDYFKLPSSVSPGHHAVMHSITAAQSITSRRRIFGHNIPNHGYGRGYGYNLTSQNTSNLPIHLRNLIDIANFRVAPQVVYGEIPLRRRNAFSEGSGESYEELLALGERIGKVEIGVTDIDVVAPKIEPDEEFKLSGCCAICHDKYDEDVDYRKTICDHNDIFCNGCLSTWLDKNRECPICMKNLEDIYIEKNKKTINDIDLENEDISDDEIINAIMNSEP